nr:DUF6318 family protein [Kineosporia sp. R_H_3]
MSCGGPGSEAVTRPTTPGTTPAPVETSRAPSPQPTLVTPSPTLPPGAAKRSDEGALAFLAYFFDVYNYSFEALDEDAVVQLGATECAFCKSARSTVMEIRSKGAHVEGGRVSIENAIVQPGGDPERGIVVNSLLAQEAGRTVGADGIPTSTSTASSRRLDALLRWKEGRWVLVGVDTATR